jgi:hypothetical protein
VEGSGGPDLLRVVVTTSAGFVVGVTVAGYLLLKEMTYSRLVSENVLGSVELSVILVVVDAAVIAVVPLLALYLRYRSVRDIRAGVIRVGLGLLAGCLSGIVAARAFASVSGYSAETRVMVCEMGIVAAGCVVGIAAGGWTWLSAGRIRT